MKLGDVLHQLWAPVGVTSLMAALFGDGSAAAGLRAMSEQRTVPTTREEAAAALAGTSDELKRQQQGQQGTKSDAAWWTFQGGISYWACVRDLLEAATLVGPSELPDVDLPSGSGALMDRCSRLERFGKTVLEQSKLVHAIRNDPSAVTLGVGPSGTDISQPPEPGTTRRVSMIKLADVERLSAPMLAVLNEQRVGESPDAILGVLMIVCGQVAAQQGVIIRGDASVESQLTPLWFGYGQAMSMAAEAAGTH